MHIGLLLLQIVEIIMVYLNRWTPLRSAY